MSRVVALVSALGLVASCTSSEPPTFHLGPPGSSATHVVVTVQQGALAGQVWRVHSVVTSAGGTSEATLPEKAAAQPLKDPFDYAVVFDNPPSGPVQLLAEALAQDGKVIGLGKAVVELKEGGGVATEIRLGRACTLSAECGDNTWCNGEEQCLDLEGNSVTGGSARGVCSPGPVACPPSAFACVRTRCVEEEQRCEVTPDSTLCEPLTGSDGGVEISRHCDAVQGCVPNVCGDGRTGVLAGVPEECDDGNASDEDGCRSDCRLNVCGDGVVNRAPVSTDGGTAPAESCDDGNTNNPNDTCNACRTVEWSPRVLLGFGISGGDPLRLPLTYPEGIALDRLGNVYFGEWLSPRIWRLDVSGKLTRVAGAGVVGYAGDQGPATNALLSEPEGLIIDGRGNIYFSDAGNHVVRRIDTTGIITTVAGTGTPGCGGDDADGPLRTELNYPTGLAQDAQGNIYIADTNNGRIRMLSAEGEIETLVGSCPTVEDVDGGAGDAGTTSTAAELERPWGVLYDLAAGTLLIAEQVGNRIREVDLSTRMLTTLVDRDAGLGGPSGMTLLSADEVLVTEHSGHRIMLLNRNTGTLTPWAGTGQASDEIGESLAELGLNQPLWITLAEDGTIYISDEYNQRVLRVGPEPGRNVEQVVGLAGPAYAGFTRPGNPVMLAQDAFMQGPNGVAVTPDGTIYVAEYEAHRVRKVDPSGIISTVLGTGESGYNGNGVGAETLVAFPDSLALDAQGNLYVTDSGNDRIRKLMPDGNVVTIAGFADGDGSGGFSGDNGPATEAKLYGPAGIAVDAAGNIFFSDASNNRIRRINPAGIITTVAGNGTDTYDPSTDEGALAVDVGIGHVYGIALDPSGNLYMADDRFHRVRRVALDGTITTVAGNGLPQSSGDGLSAVQASLFSPGAVLVEDRGGRHGLYISDTNGSRVRRVDLDTGVITTVAGSDEDGFYGDFGPADQARINLPYQLAWGGEDLIITDYGNGLVRRVDAQGNISTVAGTVHTGDGPLLAQDGSGNAGVASLSDPTALVVLPDALGWLVADGRGGRVRRVVNPDEPGNALLLTVAGYPREGPDSGRADITRLFRNASGIAYARVEGLDRVFVSERNGHVIRRVTLLEPNWTVDVFVGGVRGHRDGTVADARLDGPTGLAFDEAQRLLLVAEVGNHVIRAIRVDEPTAANAVTTLAGLPGELGFRGEDAPANTALFDSPEAVAVTTRDIYIADTQNHRIRRLDRETLTVTTVLGDGSPNSSGEGTPARFFPVDTPRGLTVDPYGNLVVGSRVAVRMVTSGEDGRVTGDDGVRTIYGAPPRDTFPQTVTRCLSGTQVHPSGERLLVLDACQGFLMELQRR
ncbi:MAG: hypothetical protein AB2A00_02410 [Myxococcota bacterium]